MLTQAKSQSECGSALSSWESWRWKNEKFNDMILLLSFFDIFE